jgi:PAS domain S-box-containing protein
LLGIIKYHLASFKYAFSMDGSSIEELEKKRREIVAVLIILFASSFLIPFSAVAFINGAITVGIVEGLLAILFISCEYFIRRKKRLEEVITFILIAISAFFLWLFISPQGSNSGHLWSFLVPISIVFLLPGYRGVAVVSVFFFSLLAFFLFDYPEGRYDVYFKIRYSGAFLAIFLVAQILETIRKRNQESIGKKNEELQKIVDELKEKDELLESSTTRYQLLFEQSNDAIFMLDGLKVIELNKKMKDIFGYSEEEIMGMDVAILSPETQQNGTSSRIKAQEYVNLALKNGSLRFEWIHQRKNGEKFPCDINLNTIVHNKKRFVIATLRDISIQKEAEKNLIEAKEKAEKSDRLKSEFLAQMSHEIRTPINAIVNFSSLLKMDLDEKLDEENKMCFSAIESSATRLMRTINLILNMSEIESDTYEPNFEQIDIAKQIIEPIQTEFKYVAKEAGLEFIFINEVPSTKTLKVDNYTMSQTLSNLVDNAIKYTNEGKVEIKFYTTGDQYIIDVSDTGIGISQRYLPMLFDKFSQEDQGYTRQFEGNGLGLALVKEYCEINNADIQVESVKGMGTKFSIILTDEKS